MIETLEQLAESGRNGSVDRINVDALILDLQRRAREEARPDPKEDEVFVRSRRCQAERDGLQEALGFLVSMVDRAIGQRTTAAVLGVELVLSIARGLLPRTAPVPKVARLYVVEELANGNWRPIETFFEPSKAWALFERAPSPRTFWRICRLDVASRTTSVVSDRDIVCRCEIAPPRSWPDGAEQSFEPTGFTRGLCTLCGSRIQVKASRKMRDSLATRTRRERDENACKSR